MSNGPECPYCECITEDERPEDTFDELIQCGNCEKWYTYSCYTTPTYSSSSLEEEIACKEVLITLSGGVGPIGTKAVLEKQKLEELLKRNNE